MTASFDSSNTYLLHKTARDCTWFEKIPIVTFLCGYFATHQMCQLWVSPTACPATEKRWVQSWQNHFCSWTENDQDVFLCQFECNVCIFYILVHFFGFVASIGENSSTSLKSFNSKHTTATILLQHIQLHNDDCSCSKKHHQKHCNQS